MTEPSSQEPKEEPESNPLDLTDLQSFSFGTQWTDAGKKHKGGDRHGSGRGPGQGRRPDRRGGGATGKDRRPPRRSFPDRGPRGEGSNEQGRGRRPEGDRSFQDRGQGQRGGRGRGVRDELPYESSLFDVGFYPDDNGFTTIIKALRTNHITYELFHVAKIFLEKSDRYVASVTRKADKGEKPERVFVSIPDGMPFQSEEEAIQHAITHHAESLFDTEEVEVDPPKGNFPFINRCGITKKLIGPPNYHRYEEFVNTHHKTQLGNTPFEKFKNSIEQVREEEAVNEWLESMKKTKRYSTKAAEGEEVQTFESLNDAIGFLRTTQRDKIVRAVNYARVSGLVLDKFANTEASRAVAGELARQRRFPLETANAIRGRLRREKFSIYKKGAKGVTLICATRRNFRKKGQVMSETLDRLIRFLESNQHIKAKELPTQFKEWLEKECPDCEYEEKKLFQDLHWLIADGYVSHFSDDSLFAQPVLENEAKAKESTKPKSSSVKPVSTDKSIKANPVGEGPVTEVEKESSPVAEEKATAEANSSSSDVVETADDASKADTKAVVASEIETPEAVEVKSQEVEEAQVVEKAEIVAPPETVAEPATESKPEPEAESKPEPATESKPEPEAESKPEPAAESKPEPEAEEVKEEPAAEPIPKQVKEEPVASPVDEKSIPESESTEPSEPESLAQDSAAETKEAATDSPSEEGEENPQTEKAKSEV